jgi:hypothetical protein
VAGPGLQAPSQMLSSQATTAMGIKAPPPGAGERGASLLPGQGGPAQPSSRRGSPVPGDPPPNQFARFRDYDWGGSATGRPLEGRGVSNRSETMPFQVQGPGQ